MPEQISGYHAAAEAQRAWQDMSRDFHEIAARLEQAVASLGYLLTHHAQTIALADARGARLATSTGAPGVEEISHLLRLPRAGVARFIEAMMELNGKVIPDAKLCARVNCARPSLKVFACEARSALRDSGFEHGISRARGHGYYMKSDEIERLVRLCEAARGNSGTDR